MLFRDPLLIIVPDYLVQVILCPKSLDELRTLDEEMFSYESPVFAHGCYVTSMSVEGSRMALDHSLTHSLTHSLDSD